MMVAISAVRPEGPPVKMIPLKVYVRVTILTSTLGVCIEAARDDDKLSQIVPASPRDRGERVPLIPVRLPADGREILPLEAVMVGLGNDAIKGAVAAIVVP